MSRLINADQLIQEFENNIATYESNEFEEGTNTGIRWCTEDVANAPTVDAVQVRHGKFIGTEYDGYADGYPVYCEWKCSECGCVFEDEEPHYNYCPNCGAKMDGEE